ncbi:MAG: transcription antitermination factor NusB [Clostridia bacterium]|nr:transcription antitermination factor NusB [Clostridia bacterium]HCA55957.1 transcription antitermination factor NusB [Oscillospiraceae bacterium]
METAENTEKKSLSRREERQQALTFVFERLFRDDSAEEVFEDATEARDEEISGYARKVVTGVEEHLTEIDTLIEENLKGWKKNRIAKMSLTILRIAVYEMCYVDNIPVSVSINEAVELAKCYATDKEAAFINGVLGSIAKQRGEKR